jgi:ribosomal protein S18 acetylase RimI-like enzyme
MELIGIRTFEEADQPTVVALWKEVFKYSNYSAPHNDPLAIIKHKLAVQPELFWVGLLNGRLVGTIVAGYDGHRGWLYSLAVAPDVRRRGIGTQLMKHAEQMLKSLGCPKINLQVVAANDSAIEVYKKLGYAIEDRISMGKVVHSDEP